MPGDREQGTDRHLAMLRQLESLAAQLKRARRQRNDLAIALSAHTGRTWEQELVAVDVEDLETPGQPADAGVMPPGPWQWRRIIPQGEASESGEALVADEGTWLCWAESGYGSPDVHPAVKDLLAKAWLLERVPGLLEAWVDYYQASTPVAQAGALVQFSNVLYHFGCGFTGDVRWITEGDEE